MEYLCLLQATSIIQQPLTLCSLSAITRTYLTCCYQSYYQTCTRVFLLSSFMSLLPQRMTMLDTWMFDRYLGFQFYGFEGFQLWSPASGFSASTCRANQSRNPLFDDNLTQNGIRMSYRVQTQFRYCKVCVSVDNGHSDTVLAVTDRLIGSPQLGDVCSFASLHTYTSLRAHTAVTLASLSVFSMSLSMSPSTSTQLFINFYFQILLKTQPTVAGRSGRFSGHSTCRSTMPERELQCLPMIQMKQCRPNSLNLNPVYTDLMSEERCMKTLKASTEAKYSC